MIYRGSVPSQAQGDLGQTISTKLRVLNAIALCVLIAIAVFAVFEKKADLLEERKLETRHLVESAFTVIEHYQQEQIAGRMSLVEAQRAALNVIRDMRYGLNADEGKYGYFFVLSDTLPVPRMIMHATRPNLDGTVPSDPMHDTATSMQSGKTGSIESFSTPKNFWAVLTTVANEAGEGYATYRTPRPLPGGGVEEAATPKISYARKFTPWGWVVCSGLYIDDIDAVFARWALLFGAVILGVGALLLVFGHRIAAGICEPIAHCAQVMQQIEASGDLAQRVPLEGGPEVIGIAKAFNQMIASFDHSVATITAVAGAVATGATSQASALEQTSASLEDMTAMTRQTASQAQASQVLMSMATRHVSESVATMAELAAAMRAMNASSQQSRNIVLAIEEIGSQTKLLAVNAAVEAARAGAAGAGFGVIANEVHSLANRVAEAAKNTTALIDETVREIDAVDTLAASTNVLFAEVAANISKVSESMAVISTGSREQAAGVAQLNTAMNEINHITQDNAALGEQLTAAIDRFVN